MYKMLIVDDNPLDRQGISGLLPWKSLSCEIVGLHTNGLDALSAIEDAQPDILLTDVQMPLMDGIELGHCVKKKYPAVQLIFMSNYNDFTFAKEALQLEATDYVLKPIRKAELQEAVTKVTNKLARERTMRQEREALLQQYRGSMPESEQGEAASYHAKLTEQVKSIIAAKYMHPITVQEIADDLFLSVSHANNLFKKQTGQKIFDYLTAYRMEKAKLLLRQSDKRIYEVVEEVGYTNKSHFCLIFKKHFGFSPSDYRSQFIVNG